MVMLAWDLGRLCRHDLLPDFSLARKTRWLPCAACAVTLWKAAGPTHSSALQTDVLFRSTVSPSSELSNPCMSGTQRQTTATTTTTTTTATCATVAEPSVHSVPAVPGIVGRMRRSAGDCLRLPLARLPKPSSGAADKIPSNAHLEDIKDASGDQREYRCRWRSCQRGFQALDDLVAHVNHCHVTAERGGEVEYQCLWEACPRKGKGFNARYKMLIHIRTHTNEKPHTCLVCGKSFSRLENLKIHNRSHTGEKPYLCPVAGCNKAYSNSSDRFKHVRTHQEQKPYTCKMPGCCKRYTDPSSLRKHVRTHGHFHRLGERSSTSLSSSSSPPSTPSSKTLSSLSPAVASSVLDSLPAGTSPLPASVCKSEESSPPVSPSKVSPPPLPPSPAVDSEANSNIRRHCSQYLLPLTGSLFPLAVGLTPPSFTSEGLIHAPRSLLSNTQTGSTEVCEKSHFQPKIVRPLPVFLTGVDPYSTTVPAKGKCGRGAVRHHQDGPLDLSCTPSSLAAMQLARCHSVHPFQELVHNVGAN